MVNASDWNSSPGGLLLQASETRIVSGSFWFKRGSSQDVTTGWAWSSGSPDESVRPTVQLIGGQPRLNRFRAVAFVSQDYRCTDSRGVAKH
jgi:hypothetical protein